MERNAKPSSSVTELRRIQIVYLLNQGGPTMEQPHKFRVNLQDSRSSRGICLRDIKRWLSHLRGKDFPEAFTWSYKRRSREDYIWQELVDDDLLNPILENEYVLLGSPKLPLSSFNDDEAMKNQSPSGKEEDSRISNPDFPVFNNKLLLLQPLELYSSEISTVLLTDGSLNLAHVKEDASDADALALPPPDSSLDFRLLLSSKKQQNKNTMKNENITDDVTTRYYSSSSSTSSAIAIPPSAESQLPKRKSRCRSKGPSLFFCNLINCGATNNYDIMMNSRRPLDDPICSPRRPTQSHQDYSAAPRKSWNVDTRDYSGQKMAVPAPAAYNKPVLGPTCSQCGKRFKPQKMHKHMKSCPGMKKAAAETLTARKSST